MAKHYLIVVDMQRDFIDGTLGTTEAEKIVPAVVEKVRSFQGEVIFTKDTHSADYLSTREGKMLPVEHCIKDTAGWMLAEELEDYCIGHDSAVYEKSTFGCKELVQDMLAKHEAEPIVSIEVVGICTDICVVSNALLLKAFLPEVEIFVDAACCAGVTPGKHLAALETMESCQVIVR